MLEVQDDTSIETPADKTDNDNSLDDLPEEGEELGVKTVDKSEIAQKIKWREKYQDAQKRLDTLETQLKASETRVEEKGELDDKEKAARAYIRNEAKKVYEELLTEQKSEETKALREFEDKIDSILEDNSEITREDLLDAIEEYDVSPETAVKILQRDRGAKPKPRMPKPRQGSPEAKPKVNDKGKDIWQIGREIKEEMKKFGL